ncbi:MAG: HD domain-containing phosphohydrolase [Solirubrobacterales bacterium]
MSARAVDTQVFRNGKPAKLLLAATIAGLSLHAAYALFAANPASGPGQLAASWTFYALALLAVGASVARSGLVHDERPAWIATSVAFGAWFIGSVYYASGGSAEASLYAFSTVDVVLAPFAGAAVFALAMLVRSRVKPFQPTILLDGMIVSLAAGALTAVVMYVVVLRGREASAAVLALKLAYPLCAAMLLAFSIWVIALIGWKPNRMWIASAIGLGLATVASGAFVVETVHGDYAAGSVLDSLWLGAGLLLVYAAWQPHDDALPVRLEGSRRLNATSIAAAMALGVLVVGQFSSVGFAAVTLAAATLVALIARAAVSFKESLQMFADARIEAQTDSLTSLGNRRKLMTDLRRELQLASVASPRVLVLFDLDGFKRYNDTYGHPAGDVLLARLGANLGRAMKPYGGAYRIGGDEFCVLVMTGASSAKTIIALAAAALSEQGEGFAIKASHGAVILPHEARDATLALKLADQRMYAHKEDRRSSATRQTRDILLQVLQEREPDLGDHLKGVAQLAMGVGTRLSLLAEELDEVVRTAELHDVGKMAIPDEILHKPGPLTDAEWSFVRQHTLIGERILSAAPALLPVAQLVRSSHEHWDGSGYPDGLAGEAIPLGARIVAVCDAFDAMTTSRPYRDAMSIEDALAEIRACAGTQFDPAVVDAFCDEIASLPHRYGDRFRVLPTLREIDQG